jgi:hypothetical protein
MKNKKAGISILGIIILAIIVILVLGYFNINIKSAVNSPTSQDNINYVEGGTENLWSQYLEKPASYLWNDVWVNIFWKGFINNMERIRDGQPTSLDNAAKNLEVQPNNTN